MTNVTFNVVSSNPNQKNGFVTKINRETSVATPFGVKTKKETYYVSGSTQLKPNEKVDVDIDMFRIQEYGFVPDIQTGEVITLKWLHLK